MKKQERLNVNLIMIDTIDWKAQLRRNVEKSQHFWWYIKCTVSSSICSKLDLMNSHISVIELSRLNFSKKLTVAFPACYVVFVFFQINIFLFTGLFILAVTCMSESIYTISWSPMPGKGLHRFTRECRLVRNKSNVCSFLVGNVMTCSKWLSWTKSRNVLL
jgi:hypothetical protein